MPLTAADIRSAEGIRTVGPEAVQQLAAITADAFRDDPFNAWLFAGQTVLHRTFFNLARHVYAPHGFCQLLQEDKQDLAATMWLMPGDKAAPSLRGQLAIYWGLLASGGTGVLQRGKAAEEAMARHHPTEPHAYLFTVGVGSAGRGRGLGRRLLTPVLEACDRTGTMAYLENSNPANQRFYASLGFERVALFHAVPGCPPLEAMRREAR